MDKNSVRKTKTNCKLKMGLNNFLDMAFGNKSVDAEIVCPCKNCGNESSTTIKVARERLRDSLSSIQFTEDIAKFIRSRKVAASFSTHSQTSDGNKLNVMEQANDIKSQNVVQEGSLPLGRTESKHYDLMAKFVQCLHSEKDPDKSITTLTELAKEVFSTQEGADLPNSFGKMLSFSGKEEDKKASIEKHDQLSVSTSSGSEEEDMATSRERNHPSASTSSGLVGYSTKEENRRKLREKINQRKEFRSSRIR